jgi:dethiobiotin synthetase
MGLVSKNTYFVTAIGTDSGKTLVSAILCRALGADYWKPIQCGSPRDSDQIKSLMGEAQIIHPETYDLKMPASPHAASKAEGVEVTLEKFILPNTTNSLIVEGAGGLMVPLNDENFVIDLIKHLNVKVILVANLYLGSINHTLLSIEALKVRNIPIEGIIFNGESNPESERIILKHSRLKVLLKIEPEPSVNSEVVNKYARLLAL